MPFNENRSLKGNQKEVTDIGARDPQAGCSTAEEPE